MVVETGKTTQKLFFGWLAEEVQPSQRQEFYSTLEILCKNIENYCIKQEVLKKPLFETLKLDTIDLVKRVVETDEDFHAAYPDDIIQMKAAVSLYHQFLSEKLSGCKIPKNSSPNAIIDPSFLKPVVDVLATRFSNGFRLNSPIEMTRFRAFILEDSDIDISCSDENLKEHILNSGVLYEGKVYVVSPTIKKQIAKYVEDYFSTGAQVIFYTAFYAKNEKSLFEANVVSEEMLVIVLRELFPLLFFTHTYFGYVKEPISTVLEREILRVWNDDVLLTYDMLAARLPYIPLQRIKNALGQNGAFIWNSFETYTHISQIKITDEECKAIRAVAAQECDAWGYASMVNLPLDDIQARNDELSTAAVHSAVYRLCLQDRFDKNGKIITRQGDVFNIQGILEDYCRALDKCSLGDLLLKEKELTGEVHRWAPMEAGYAVMVRIDKENFVAEKYVHFDIDEIDKIIGRYVSGEYLPLQSFTAFGAFPDCGQSWTPFLLESYCRRFSQQFRFDVPAVNSKNAGAVIRRSCTMEYVEIMADAVSLADISLDPSAVCGFLYEKGYIGKRTNSTVREIIEKAKVLRKRGN